MRSVRGVVAAETGGSFRGHQVQLSFATKIDIGADGHQPTTPGSVSAACDDDGTFTLQVPDDASGPWSIDLLAPDGSRLLHAEYPRDLPDPIKLSAEPTLPVPVRPSPDPLLGRRFKVTGRVLDTAGKRQASDLQVAIWALATEAVSEPRVLAIARTDMRGYFSFEYPRGRFASAYGVVGTDGGKAIPIALEGGAFPRAVILAVDLPEGEDEEACACTPTAPRGQDPIDVVTSPESFSADAGRCVDFTTPNRAIEEFSFYTVVRTTEPAIQGFTLTDGKRPLRPEIVGAITTLAGARMAGRIENAPIPRISGDALAKVAETTTAITASDLALAAELTVRDEIVHLVDLGKKPVPARGTLSASNPIDWDAEPTFYQAASIAHGHLLHFKQVWRADGYSLGDLLYSLPLAPCQKKQIAVVDWERREIGERIEERTVSEEVTASLSRDRDISEIVQSTLTENLRGASAAATFGLSSIIGKGLGVLGLGVAGSGAIQDSSRSLSANTLQQIRDQTLQAASSVRSQRSTVVQTVRQGETVRAQTEVVTNHNHCHALTVQYFEVLRHFLVTQELAEVQECLFIPLFLSRFDMAKVLRWRTPLSRALTEPSLRRGFDSLERMRNNWVDSDLPTERYSDEVVTELSGEFRISFVIPRPSDNDAGDFLATAWLPFQPFIAADLHALFSELLLPFVARDRDRIFQERIAPRIVRGFLDTLTFHYIGESNEQKVPLDPTMVSTYATDREMLVTVRPAGALPSWPRERIRAFEIRATRDLPVGSRAIVQSGTIHYRTAHFSHDLFRDSRILNDLLVGDPVRITTWPSRDEQRNPRSEDRELARRLLAHLNEHLEHYHKVLWWTMDPDRRFMLLDGFIAPNSGGRSVASVVENRLLGVVGNCLVMPVAPGIHLDPTLRIDRERPIELLQHYAPTTPVPAMRVSVPTRGVFAEAVMGACNSCEEKDDARFWRFEESPCGDEPTVIQPPSTESRRAEPGDLRPQEFPTPIVNLQNAPAAPDPTGLAAALQAIGAANAFRDVTGLAQNQQNAMASLAITQDTLRHMVTAATGLAKEKNAQQNLPSAMQTLYQAMNKGLVDEETGQELATGLFKNAGAEARGDRKVTDEPQMKALLKRDNLTSVTYHRPPEFLQASYVGKPQVEVGEMVTAENSYGGYDLKSGDKDAGTVYAGKKRTAAAGDTLPAADAKGFVRELQDDLAELGFAVGTPDGDFGRMTKWAVREFQIHAKMDNIAVETAGSGAPARYVDRLSATANTIPYTGPISGVANGQTRLLIKYWIANRWRCPVVIEAMNFDSSGNPTSVATGQKGRAGNLWLHDDHPDTAPRIFATDFSGTYTLPTGRTSGTTYPLGTYTTWTGWGGPEAFPPNLTWPTSEITPETLVGKAASSLSASERSTFKVIRAVSEVETWGFFDALNAYDNVFTSMGIGHWPIGEAKDKFGGELCAYFAFLEENDPDAFEEALGRFGVRAAKSWTNDAGDLALYHQGQARYHTTLALQKEDGAFASMSSLGKLTKDDLNWFRSWHWFYRFAMAGRTISGFQRGMWTYARLRLRDLRRIQWGHGMAPVRNPDTGMFHAATIGDVYTSERALAMIMRWHIRYPGEMVSGGGPGERLRNARRRSGLPTGANWADGLTDANEQALIQGLLDEAQARGGVFSTIQEVHNWPSWHGGSNPRGYTLNPATLDPSSTRLSAARDSMLVEDGDLPGFEPMFEWVP